MSLKEILVRQCGDSRLCPHCNGHFVPNDQLALDTWDLYKKLFWNGEGMQIIYKTCGKEFDTKEKAEKYEMFFHAIDNFVREHGYPGISRNDVRDIIIEHVDQLQTIISKYCG